MLCLACGAEMRLVQVAKDTTMLVSGYEHHTWQCSGCSTVEQRMTFTHEGTPNPTVPVESTQTVPAEPAQAVPVELIQTVPVVRAHPTPPAAMPQTNARLEKLRSLQERATAAKEAVRETERRAQFERDWDNLRSVPSHSALSEALSHVTPDEPVRSPTEPIASPAPTAHDGSIPPNTLRGRRTGSSRSSSNSLRCSLLMNLSAK
jgi:hypothetical protein